jgi:hypothetical protein
MRVAVIVLTMLWVATPSGASQSCMSKTEARQHFGSAHIYWHGQDHCWDATPMRHRQIQVRRKTPVHEVQQKIDQPKWRESMSEMLPDHEPVQLLEVLWDAWQHRSDDGAVTGTPWVDRWVDIGQVVPSPTTERKPEPMISARAVVLVFITSVLILTLATIELLFRGTIHE